MTSAELSAKITSRQYGQALKDLEVYFESTNGRLSELSKFTDTLGIALVDFSDTAAVVDQLDLVVSVDTSVAHLAGALGRPIWTLIPFLPDWRWQLEGEISPWYPTMRLFRQSERNNWKPAMDQVTNELRKTVAKH